MDEPALARLVVDDPPRIRRLTRRHQAERHDVEKVLDASDDDLRQIVELDMPSPPIQHDDLAVRLPHLDRIAVSEVDVARAKIEEAVHRRDVAALSGQ